MTKYPSGYKSLFSLCSVCRYAAVQLVSNFKCSRFSICNLNKMEICWIDPCYSLNLSAHAPIGCRGPSYATSGRYERFDDKHSLKVLVLFLINELHSVRNMRLLWTFGWGYEWIDISWRHFVQYDVKHFGVLLLKTLSEQVPYFTYCVQQPQSSFSSSKLETVTIVFDS